MFEIFFLIFALTVDTIFCDIFALKGDQIFLKYLL